jgi:excisionase family DNA binding protein
MDGIFVAMEENPLQQALRRALDAQRQALNELEEAVVGYEESLSNRTSSTPPAEGQVPKLHSIEEVCRALGMGKSWTYRKIKSGEIPSIKLGRSIKVKREDLEEYLEARRYQPAQEVD